MTRKLMQSFKYHLIILCLVLFTSSVHAQEFSYVYIQGDKETPFYVKLEDQMLPRYGKNYSIISQLAPGPVNLQVLFQQNIYPPQKFAINVPENGSRGFLLMKKGDAFSLYDIQKQFYIPAGNSIEDDKWSAQNTEELTPVVNTPPVKTEPKTIVAAKKKTPEKKTPVVKKTVVKPTPKKTEIVKNTEPAGPLFMDDIELKNDRTGQSSATISKDGNAEPFKNAVAIINSDCPKAISNTKFDNIYKKANDKSGDSRLKYLLEQLDNCYTTNQARMLTRTLKSEAERYTFLKNIYSRITDQSAFPKLENLLTTDEWKEYFKSILPK